MDSTGRYLLGGALGAALGYLMSQKDQEQAILDGQSASPSGGVGIPPAPPSDWRPDPNATLSSGSPPVSAAPETELQSQPLMARGGPPDTEPLVPSGTSDSEIVLTRDFLDEPLPGSGWRSTVPSAVEEAAGVTAPSDQVGAQPSAEPPPVQDATDQASVGEQATEITPPGPVPTEAPGQVSAVAGEAESPETQTTSGSSRMDDLKSRIEETRRRIRHELEQPFDTLAASGPSEHETTASAAPPVIEPGAIAPATTPPVTVESGAAQPTDAEPTPMEQVALEQAPVEQIPIEQVSVEEVPVEQMPVEEVPAEQVTAGPPAAQAEPTEPPTSGSVDAPPMAAEPATVEPPVVEQAPVGQPPVEQVSIEEAPLEQAPVEAPVEQVSIDQSPVEQPPVEEPTVEQEPAEPEPVEQAPVEQVPSEPFPAEVEPAELTATSQVEVSPGVAEPKTAAPIGAELPVVEQTPVEQLPVEQVSIEEAPLEQAPVEQVSIDQALVEQPLVEEPTVEQEPGEPEPVEQMPEDQRPLEKRTVEEVVAEPETAEAQSGEAIRSALDLGEELETASEADLELGEPVDYDSMKDRIERTRSRLKAKAFDAMMTGESALLGRDLDDTAATQQAVPDVDSEVDETIESSLREEEE